jgi:ubiquitin-protein ligase
MSHRRILNELSKLKGDATSPIRAESVADELYHLRATIQGPEGTPYEGGVFIIDIRLPHEYPLKPPECSFATKIYHPNSGPRGEICMDILKGDWNPSQSIEKVLNVILGLLQTPDVGNALNTTIASQYSNDRPTFDRLAREWTAQYAMEQ